MRQQTCTSCPRNYNVQLQLSISLKTIQRFLNYNHQILEIVMGFASTHPKEKKMFLGQNHFNIMSMVVLPFVGFWKVFLECNWIWWNTFDIWYGHSSALWIQLKMTNLNILNLFLQECEMRCFGHVKFQNRWSNYTALQQDKYNFDIIPRLGCKLGHLLKGDIVVGKILISIFQAKA